LIKEFPAKDERGKAATASYSLGSCITIWLFGHRRFPRLAEPTSASYEALLVRPGVAGLAQWISPRCVKHSQLQQTCNSACGAKRLAQALSNEKQDRKPSACHL